MARPAAGKEGTNPAPRLAAWGLALVVLVAAFMPLSRDSLRGIHWVLCLFALLEAALGIGRGRRGAFLVYTAIAVLMNPIRPFTFAVQTWRLLHAAAALWLAADHLPNRR